MVHLSTPASSEAVAVQPETIQLRAPAKADGFSVHQLVAACPPLDPNSIYCNLLQCHHFSDTCVLAESQGMVLGFISAYRPPSQPDCLFIWQVAVHPNARGFGLGKRMLREILARPACAGVTRLHTTITPDNQASWALFRSLARDLEAQIQEQVEYERQRHFGGQHADEVLLDIAPIRIAGQPLHPV